MFYVPVHDRRRQHWYAFVGFPACSRIYVIDSLRLEGPHYFPDIEVFGKILGSIHDVKDWDYKVCMTNPQQPNDYDCGLNVCLAAVCLAKESVTDAIQILETPYEAGKLTWNFKLTDDNSIVYRKLISLEIKKNTIIARDRIKLDSFTKNCILL